MNTHTMKALSASALAALVLIWDEAPIADSPSWHVASAESEDRPLPNVNAGPATKQRSDAVVRGDRTGVGPAARPAKPGPPVPAPADEAEGKRTGVGPAADTGVPAKNIGH
jgi:hypothetical protein